MGVSMIRQKLGNRTLTNYVPAGDEEAKALADAVLPGEYEIFTKVGESGSDVVAGGYKKFTVMIKNEGGLKTYFNIVTSQSKTSTDVINALKGKTFDTVKADVVYVLNERDYIIADTSGGGSNP
jgi:hypothetical protein